MHIPGGMATSIPVKVALRCRPLVAKEMAEGCQQCVEFIPNEPQIVIGSDRSFTYDCVFRPEIAQQHMYEATVKPLVEHLFKGFNVTVLAYGQTGSGKTFTMGTNFSEMTPLDPESHGVIPRAVDDIFNCIEQKATEEYYVKVSFLEIYNEDIIDLLSPASAKTEICLREDATGGIKLLGLYELPVRSMHETINCLIQGSNMRTTGSTAMNTQSSRSHAIFTISLECKNKEDGSERFFSKFHFVDLAGSERAKKTKAQGERFKEGVNINLGLLALSNVICALCQGSARNHVPYRESKLTRLLQDSLGGNSHTMMIACISPADSNMEETINTLRYAQRARKIKNKPIINRDPNMAEIARLKKLVQQLQEELIKYQNFGASMDPSKSCMPLSLPANDLMADRVEALVNQNQELDSENKRLATELDALIGQTADLYEKALVVESSQQQMKEKLEELKLEASTTLDLVNCSYTQEQRCQFKEQIDKIQQLKDKVSEIQIAHQNVTTKLGETFTYTDALNGEADDTTDEYLKQGTLRQAEMNKELLALNKALALKEDLASRLTVNDDKFNIMKLQYEESTKQLENEISLLQQEKEDLCLALKQAQSNTAANKISEQRRKRLKELEEQISDMKKKLTEYSKIHKIKEQNEQQIKKLNNEILEMKQVRVRLVRQLKSESEKQRQFKNAKEKELCQVKAQERRCQLEIVRKQQKFDKEQLVWKIKMDSAIAANKRLKEVLLQQKLNAEKRGKGPGDLGANKLKDTINQELEFAFRYKEARRHLDSLLEDRKVLTEQLQKLKSMLDKNSSTSSGDSDSSNRENGSETIIPETKKRISEIEGSIQCRNIQIAELQQKLLDTDLDDKAKSRWNNIHSMAEAKLILKLLFENCVTAKFESARKEDELAEARSHYDQLDMSFRRVVLDYENLGREHELELLRLHQEHQDKVHLLLNNLPSPTMTSVNDTGDHSLVQRLKILEEELSTLLEVKEQLTLKTRECETLKMERGETKLSWTQSRLLPEIHSSSLDPLIAKLSPQQKQKKKYHETKDEVLCSETDLSDVDDVKMDPDWFNTPLMQRMQKLKNKSSILQVPALTLDTSDSDFESPIKPRKRKSDEDKCSCRTGCTTKRCKCLKLEQTCTMKCQCGSSCKNQSYKKLAILRTDDDEKLEV